MYIIYIHLYFIYFGVWAHAQCTNILYTYRYVYNYIYIYIYMYICINRCSTSIIYKCITYTTILCIFAHTHIYIYICIYVHRRVYAYEKRIIPLCRYRHISNEVCINKPPKYRLYSMLHIHIYIYIYVCI